MSGRKRGGWRVHLKRGLGEGRVNLAITGDRPYARTLYSYAPTATTEPDPDEGDEDAFEW